MARYVEIGYWETGYAEGDSLPISVNSAVHSHVADQPAITFDAGTITINSADHSHTIDSPTVDSSAGLTINGIVHGHTAEQPSISTAATLSINDATHAHTADQVTITDINLVIADATHAHIADPPTVTWSGSVAVNSGTHSQAAQAPPVTFEDTQLLVATADNSNTNWKRSDTGATSNLFPLLDEGDEDSIYCTDDGAIANFQFTSALEPNRDTDHRIRYRISGDGSSNLTVRLKDGGTTIATWVETAPSTTPQTIDRVLTTPQAQAITNYADLRLEFEETA